MGNNIIKPTLPTDIIAFIGEKCCQMDPFFAIKFWQVTKKLHQKPNIIKYYLIAKRLLLQKFFKETHFMSTPNSTRFTISIIKNSRPSRATIGTLNSYSWLTSPDLTTYHIFGKNKSNKTHLKIRNDVNNWIDSFVTIQGGIVEGENRVSKIIWKSDPLYPEIKIFY
jgi:hypothetical protein